LVIVFLLFSNLVFADWPKDEPETFFDLPLEALMQIKISLPTKKSEQLFDSPLSASVLTRKEIQNSGVLTIPEALRLVPGLMVREQSPGNFDVHIRGFDNIPPDNLLAYAANSSTLVMIDNRIVYNYFQGGTFWETLPISVHDVERIEVVRGPAAALYGPNAVTGVINIITRRPEKKGWSINAHVDGGNFNSHNEQLSVFYNHEDVLNLGMTANTSDRDRHRDDYYDWYRDGYTDYSGRLINYTSGKRTANSAERYPHHKKSLDVYGLNAFVSYTPNDAVQVDLRGGYQNSWCQKAFVQTVSLLTTNESQSRYLDLAVKAHNFSAQFSLNDGDQDTLGVYGWKYNFTTYDFTAEYDFDAKGLCLRPGINLRRVVYDGDFIGGSQELTTQAYFVRAEYQLSDSTRVMGAIRVDNYNHPDDRYLSWQLGITRKLGGKNLLRLVYARSNRAPFMVNTYMDFTYVSGGTTLIYSGNRDLDMMTMDMIEVGFRHMFSDTASLDIEAFYCRADDYDILTIADVDQRALQTVNYYEYNNIDIRAQQVGLTLSLSAIPRPKLTLKTFATLQYTKLEDHTPRITEAKKEHDMKHTETPVLYGGVYLNYRFSRKLNLNTNLYTYTRQKFRNELRSVNVGSKINLNAKLTYRLTDRVKLYFNARNLLDDHEKEFAFADEIMGTYLLGMDMAF